MLVKTDKLHFLKCALDIFKREKLIKILTNLLLLYQEFIHSLSTQLGHRTSTDH